MTKRWRAKKAKRSDRGFYGFLAEVDNRGVGVRLYESSVMEGGLFVWLAVENLPGCAYAPPWKPGTGHAHMTKQQARALRDALNIFLEDT